MALLYGEDRNWVLAAQAYESAIALDLTDATTRYKLGLAWLEARQPRKATAAFEAAAMLAPDEKLIKLSLGRARREAVLAERAAGPAASGDEPAAGEAP